MKRPIPKYLNAKYPISSTFLSLTFYLTLEILILTFCNVGFFFIRSTCLGILTKTETRDERVDFPLINLRLILAQY